MDHLKVTLERQLESKEARKEMLVKMALTNVNSAAKTILRSLPLYPEPTIDQMIEACVKHSLMENTVAQAVAEGIAQEYQELLLLWQLRTIKDVLIVVALDNL